MIEKIDYSEPIKSLLADLEITEILICNQNEIWYEKKGAFFKHSLHFESLIFFQNFIHLLCDESSIQFNYEHPFADGHWRGFRVHVCSPPISTDITLTLRRLKPNHIEIEQLQKTGWCNLESLAVLKNAIQQRKNILVVGSTGSGKTTLLNSLVALAASDRCVFIEDTSELVCPNLFSQKLLTRKDYQGSLPEISQSDLLKQSLRMRPDRLIIGEVRGGEAKDLLMALSTGHGGSMTSLHAGSAAEALLRLEMLVQMGAPQWSLSAIRRLIQLTIDCIVVTKKDKENWRLDGIYKIASLESFGFSVENLSHQSQASISR